MIEVFRNVPVPVEFDLDEFVADGLDELQASLRRHAEFAEFCERRDEVEA